MLEVTLRTPQALQCIEAIAKEVLRGRGRRGHRSWRAADAQASALAGAKFGVSPGYTRAVGKACHDLGLPPAARRGDRQRDPDGAGGRLTRSSSSSPRCKPACLPMLKAWQRPFGDVAFCPTAASMRAATRPSSSRLSERGLRGRLVDRADRRDPRDGDWARIEQLARAASRLRAGGRCGAREFSTLATCKVNAFDSLRHRGRLAQRHCRRSRARAAGRGRRDLCARLARRLPACDDEAGDGAHRGGRGRLHAARRAAPAACSSRCCRDFDLTDRLDAPPARPAAAPWHRLPAWPDVGGEARAASNASSPSARLLERQHRLADRDGQAPGLPWDCVLSAEGLQGPTSPTRATYLGGGRRVRCGRRGQVMLAAAHHDDLAAARVCGLKTVPNASAPTCRPPRSRECFAAAGQQPAARGRYQRTGRSAGLLGSDRQEVSRPCAGRALSCFDLKVLAVYQACSGARRCRVLEARLRQ